MAHWHAERMAERANRNARREERDKYHLERLLCAEIGAALNRLLGEER